MSAVKGKVRENKPFEKELFIGFTSVTVAAINPTRDQLNKLVGKEGSDTDEEITYLSQDKDGNPRVRLAVWLRDEKTGKFYVYSFNIVDKERLNEGKDKVQILNSVCTTTWTKYDNGQIDDELLPEWFRHFTKSEKGSKEKEIIGDKKWRIALSGEEELATLTRAWLGRLSFSDPDAEVLFDTKKLLSGNVKELTSLIDGDFDAPFVVLLGVKTDQDDKTKKYQQVWGKSFLPNGFMKYINNGFKFPSDYTKNTWAKFEEEVEGEYGFKAHHDLCPIREYNEAEDITAGDETKTPASTGSDY